MEEVVSMLVLVERNSGLKAGSATVGDDRLFMECRFPSRYTNQFRRGCRLAAILIAGLLSACATSSGSTYERGSSGEGSALARAKAAKTADDAEEKEESATKPPSTEKSGDDSSSFVFVVAPAAPPPPSGRLALDGLPPGAIAWINDGDRVIDGSALSPGRHLLRVEAFGYDDFETVIDIAVNRTTAVRYVGRRLPFGIFEVASTTATVKRDRLGLFNTLGWHGQATAPGRLRAEIADSEGRVVRELPAIDVFWRNWDLVWDGRDDDGRLPSEGQYTARFYEAPARTGGRTAQAVAEDRPLLTMMSFTIVDDSTPLQASSQFCGVSGALFAPDARTLPGGHLDSSLGAVGHFAVDGGGSYGRVPGWISLRIGLGAGEGAEIGMSGSLTLSTDSAGDDVSSAGVSGAFKMTVLRLRGDAAETAAGFWLRLSYGSFLDKAAAAWPTPWDGATRFPGIGGGLVAEALAGPVRIYAAAEVSSYSFYPGWDDNRYEVPGLFVWGYLRGGADAVVGLGSAGSLALRLSGALRAGLNYQSFSPDPPYSLGAELNWYSPRNGFIPGFIAIAEIESPQRYFVYSGFGVNWLF